MVQVWLGWGHRRFRFGSGLDRIGADAVEMGIRCGTGFASIGEKAFQKWFTFISVGG